MRVTIVKSDARSREKPCLKCGYSLRKLTDSRHCPECGLSVWLSLSDNDSLAWSNPTWLRNISIGAWMMAAAQPVGMLAFVVQFAPISNRYWHLVLLTILLGLYLLIDHAGMLLLASHEQRYPDRLKLPRNAAGIIAVIGLILGFALIFGGILGKPLVHSPIWTFPVKALLLASAIATWSLLRPLARRIPSSFLARFCGYMLLAPLISFFKFFPFFFFFLAMEAFSFLDLLPAVYLPLSLFLFIRFAIAFARNSISASASWASEMAGAEPPKSKENK